MTVKKRDQRQYDLVQQYLSGLILNTILGIIRELGDPYEARPGLGGMTAYPPMAIAVVCMMLEAERTTYRKMVGILHNNVGMAAKMGLERIPSKSTIARAYGLIPEWYLAEVHRTAIRTVETGPLAGDSTELDRVLCDQAMHKALVPVQARKATPSAAVATAAADAVAVGVQKQG